MAAWSCWLGRSVTFMTDDVPRVLKWEREELILAGDLVVRNGWRQIAATDPEVIELSALLRRLPLHAVEDHRSDFRNVNSVARRRRTSLPIVPAMLGGPRTAAPQPSALSPSWLRSQTSCTNSHSRSWTRRHAETSRP